MLRTASHRNSGIATALDLASHELTRLLGLHELCQALSAPQFLNSMSGSTASAGSNTVRTSLTRNTLTITVALFDGAGDPCTCDVPQRRSRTGGTMHP